MLPNLGKCQGQNSILNNLDNVCDFGVNDNIPSHTRTRIKKKIN